MRRAALTLAVVAALVSCWLLFQLGMLELGNRARADGDPVTAEARYNAVLPVLALERWSGWFNRGVARGDQSHHDGAAADFATAAGLAPASQECMVRLNWAWSLEAAADDLAALEDRQGAQARYREAESVLADTDCTDEPDPTTGEGLDDQWSSTRQRLEEKRGGAPSESGQPEQEAPSPSADEALDQRQRRAQQEFQSSREQQGEAELPEESRTW